MKCILLLMGLVIFSGCDLRNREAELDSKMSALQHKEQELSLKEQSLDYRELQLNEREKDIDSSVRIITDSVFLEHQKLPGTWLVEMQCTKTNCQGSAVGDIKNELWDIKFLHNMVVASAVINNRVVRIYTGNFSGNILKLAVQEDSTENTARISVRLKQTKEKEMTGEREIIQANGCHILYSLRLKKQ
ncbi:MAG: hypothetical protein ABI237_18645 [Ginsengibacter sp.]